MTYTENIWLYTALLFGIIIVPGMDSLFVLANSLTGGRKLGLAAVAGIMLGGVFHTVFGAVGVGVILKLAPRLFTVMLVAGAGYMAWIGYTLVKSSIRVDAVGKAIHETIIEKGQIGETYMVGAEGEKNKATKRVVIRRLDTFAMQFFLQCDLDFFNGRARVRLEHVAQPAQQGLATFLIMFVLNFSDKFLE